MSGSPWQRRGSGRRHLMSAIAQNRINLQAGVISLVAAVFAASVVMVSNRGFAAPVYALTGVGIIGLLLFSFLTYTRPLIVLTTALIFLTSPMSLVLSLQWS